MYIAVCDDQAEELQQLNDLLEEWQQLRQTGLRVRSFRSAGELLDAAKREPFTLYLLDIMMPGTDGLSAAKELRMLSEDADIVFITSSPGFAYESYSVRASDYLLKPVRGEQLFPLLDRLLLSEQHPRSGLVLKRSGTLIRVLFSQLAYVEVNGKHLYFNMIDGTVHEIFGSMSEYEEALLIQPEFMRVHRSYIVNMLQVAELSSGRLKTFSGREIPVSRLLRTQVQKDYMKLLFSEGTEKE